MIQGPVPAEKGHVLVVDDVAGTLEIIERNLVNDGYRVSVAADAREALSVIRKTSVDLVITDLKMPGSSGLKLIRHIKMRHGIIKTMLITGYNISEQDRGTDPIDADNSLMKPFTCDELLSMVERIMEDPSERKGNDE